MNFSPEIGAAVTPAKPCNGLAAVVSPGACAAPRQGTARDDVLVGNFGQPADGPFRFAAEGDGLTGVNYTRQRSPVDGRRQTPIEGAAASTSTLTADDVGGKIKFEVSLTHGFGFEAQRTGAHTGAHRCPAGGLLRGRAGPGTISSQRRHPRPSPRCRVGCVGCPALSRHPIRTGTSR